MRHCILMLMGGLVVSCAHFASPITEIHSETLLAKSQITHTVKEHAATVVVFLSPTCPCSLSHEPILAELKKEFPNYAFMGIIPAHEEAESHYQDSPISFPLLNDSDGKLATQFQALKTPHVFVLGRQGEMLYRGAIDDSHIASSAKKFYLKEALLAISRGQKPEISETSPLGCGI